jgi:hypothetical protein
MKNALSNARRFGILLTILFIAGCSAMDTNVKRLNSDVQKIPLGEPYPITAKVLTSAMLQAGFKLCFKRDLRLRKY